MPTEDEDDEIFRLKAKHVFWTSNPLGTFLGGVFMDMVELGVLEYGKDEERSAGTPAIRGAGNRFPVFIYCPRVVTMGGKYRLIKACQSTLQKMELVTTETEPTAWPKPEYINRVNY
jgi:hypothetical protein